MCVVVSFSCCIMSYRVYGSCSVDNCDCHDLVKQSDDYSACEACHHDVVKHKIAKVIVAGLTIVDNTAGGASQTPIPKPPTKPPSIPKPPTKPPTTSGGGGAKAKTKAPAQIIFQYIALLSSSEASEGLRVKTMSSYHLKEMEDDGKLIRDVSINCHDNPGVVWTDLQTAVFGNSLDDSELSLFQQFANSLIPDRKFTVMVPLTKTTKKLEPTKYTNKVSPDDVSTIKALAADLLVIVPKKSLKLVTPKKEGEVVSLVDDSDDAGFEEEDDERYTSRHYNEQYFDDDIDNRNYKRQKNEVRSQQSIADEKRGRDARQNEEQAAALERFKDEKDAADRKKKEEDDVKEEENKLFQEWKKSKKDDEEKKSNELHDLLNEVTKNKDDDDDSASSKT